MNLVKYSQKIARETLPERFAYFLCNLFCQMDNISAYYKKSEKGINLAVGFSFRGSKPQEFFWLNINLDRNDKEINVIWNESFPRQKFSLHCCGILQRAILNYVSLRRGELLALLCWARPVESLCFSTGVKFATIGK